MRLRISGRWWRVEKSHDLPDGCMGETRLDERRILIRAGLSEQDHASTLFHELLHAASPSLDEARVGRIERAIFPLLWADGFRPKTLWRLK